MTLHLYKSFYSQSLSKYCPDRHPQKSPTYLMQMHGFGVWHPEARKQDNKIVK
jgi:hypothetical protein